MSLPRPVAAASGPLERLGEREVLFERGRREDAEATVAISLYDYEDMVVEALESAYDQTLERLGLVVLDDASTDGGGRRVRTWMDLHGARFAHVLLARHRSNGGLAAARNSAFDLSSSGFVMALDADNQLNPRCVERLLSSLRDSGFGFAYSIIEQFGEWSGLMGCDSWNVEQLKKGNYIDAMALVRKRTWQRVGGYSKMGVGGWEDYDFWCKCVDAGIEGLFVPEILARYRVHGGSMLRRETDVERNRKRIRREMRKRHPWLEC